MRLIDATELIEVIEGNENLIDLQKDELIECVDACDTAYDVDAVVEQLEDYSDADEADAYGTIPVIELDRAIEIVKGGGVNAKADS